MPLVGKVHNRNFSDRDSSTRRTFVSAGRKVGGAAAWEPSGEGFVLTGRGGRAGGSLPVQRVHLPEALELSASPNSHPYSLSPWLVLPRVNAVGEMHSVIALVAVVSHHWVVGASINVGVAFVFAGFVALGGFSARWGGTWSDSMQVDSCYSTGGVSVSFCGGVRERMKCPVHLGQATGSQRIKNEQHRKLTHNLYTLQLPYFNSSRPSPVAHTWSGLTFISLSGPFPIGRTRNPELSFGYQMFRVSTQCCTKTTLASGETDMIVGIDLSSSCRSYLEELTPGAELKCQRPRRKDGRKAIESRKRGKKNPRYDLATHDISM